MVQEKCTFESYYEQYYRQVYLYIAKKINNIHDAEDIAMDAFASCYEKFDSFDPERASFQTWLYVIVNNKLKNHYRDSRSFVDLDDPEQYEEPCVEGFEDEMVAAEYLGEMRNELAAALEMLNDTQKTIVVESYFHNRNSKEIASLLCMSDVNVRVQLSRALKKMKEYFDKNNIIWEM